MELAHCSRKVGCGGRELFLAEWAPAPFTRTEVDSVEAPTRCHTPKIFDHFDPQFRALGPFPKWKVDGAHGPATGWRARAWLGSPALAANPRLAWNGNRTVIWGGPFGALNSSLRSRGVDGV